VIHWLVPCDGALFKGGLCLIARAAGQRLAGADINADLEQLVKFQYLGLGQSLSYRGRQWQAIFDAI
jgi:hypothetical protein